MRIILIIISLIFIESVNAQNNVTELKSFIDDLEKTDSIKQKIETAEFQNFQILSVYVELDRTLDFEFRNYRISLMLYSGWPIKLNLISKNKNIKFGWISEYNSEKEKHRNKLYFEKPTSNLDKFISQHNSYYKTSFDKNDLREQLITEYVVGFGCGFSGNQISKEAKKTLEYVENKNVKKLSELLKSFSPELQTLGTIGLLKIADINEQQGEIIKHLKQLNFKIYSCSGCVYGIEETYNERIDYYEKNASR